MKTRNGFVSNSSSSSFVVSKKHLTTIQMFFIMNYDLVSKFLLEHMLTDKELLNDSEGWDITKELLNYAEGWDITETETEIKGNTGMDNFGMQEYMRQIGIPIDLATFV